MTSAIAVSESEYKETKREYDDTCLATPKFHDQAPHLRQNYMMQKQYTEKKDDILKGLEKMRGEVRRSPVYHVCAYWTRRANAGLFADMGVPPPHRSASPSTESSSLTLSGTPPASIANSPGLTITPFVTFSFPPQPLTTVFLPTSRSVLPSAFTAQTLPPLLTLPGMNLSFTLAPFLSNIALANIKVSTLWDPGNVMWLAFDAKVMIISRGMPDNAPPSVKFAFEACDVTSGTISRTGMLISVGNSGGVGSERMPTDHVLRRTGKKLGVAVSIVFGILSSIVRSTSPPSTASADTL